MSKRTEIIWAELTLVLIKFKKCQCGCTLTEVVFDEKPVRYMIVCSACRTIIADLSPNDNFRRLTV